MGPVSETESTTSDRKSSPVQTNGSIQTEKPVEKKRLTSKEEFKELHKQKIDEELTHLRKQLQDLEAEKLPEYQKGLKRLIKQKKETIHLLRVNQSLECEMVEKEFRREKEKAKIDLEKGKETLQKRLEHRLTADRNDLKAQFRHVRINGRATVYTVDTGSRKRRRGLSPPTSRKRFDISKTLKDAEIEHDLGQIRKFSRK